MTGQNEQRPQLSVLEPTWQNFSSMYREAVCAQEASTGMEISHHRMAALYFGIATIECFFRGNLTHLKNYWPGIFDELSRTDPMEVVELVAEYVIAFHHAKGELFPYWVLGWNYLCPNRDGYQISLLPETQFLHSLSSLGYKPQLQPFRLSREHEQEFLSDFDAKLCRRWWEPAHQKSCGAATPEAIARALELDEMRARRLKAKAPTVGINSFAGTSTWVQKAAGTLKRWFHSE